MITRWTLVFLIWLLPACTGRPAALPAPGDVLPSDGAVPGWERESSSVFHGREALEDYLDDEADVYVAYGLQELAVAQYTNAGGGALRVEVSRVATDADAFGLFTRYVRGKPIDLGVDGGLETGHKLGFWQSRTFVQVVAEGQIADNTLHTFGEAVGSGLPGGGERPPLVEVLPAEGMQPGSVRYFCENVAAGNPLRAASENALGLGEDTEGVLARYEIDGHRIALVLVTFPNAARVRAARAGLREAGIEGLIAVEAKERALGAVFGRVDEGATPDSGCSCSSEELASLFGRLPEDVAGELLDEAMSALP